MSQKCHKKTSSPLRLGGKQVVRLGMNGVNLAAILAEDVIGFAALIGTDEASLATYAQRVLHCVAHHQPKSRINQLPEFWIVQGRCS
jgi:hypothetical protein